MAAANPRFCGEAAAICYQSDWSLVEDAFDTNHVVILLHVVGRDDDFFLLAVLDKGEVKSEVLSVALSEKFRVGINLLEEESGNRQSHTCALSVGHAVEVNRAVFASYPCTYDEVGRERHEPAVGVVV